MRTDRSAFRPADFIRSKAVIYISLLSNIYIRQKFHVISTLHFLTLIFVIMPIICCIFALENCINIKSKLMIEVEVFNFLSSGQKKFLFRKEVNLPDGLYFPYDTLSSNLRLLFGNDVYISFIVSPQ